MGELRRQRAGLIAQWAKLTPYPESGLIDDLVQVKGIPLYGMGVTDSVEFVRTVAVARITMPRTRVHLSAGRRELGEPVQGLCFLAGENSVFLGGELLTMPNPEAPEDLALLAKLGIRARVGVGSGCK